MFKQQQKKNVLLNIIKSYIKWNKKQMNFYNISNQAAVVLVPKYIFFSSIHFIILFYLLNKRLSLKVEKKRKDLNGTRCICKSFLLFNFIHGRLFCLIRFLILIPLGESNQTKNIY